MGRPLSAPKPLPSVERLKEIMDYDAATGELVWKERGPESFASFSSDLTSRRWNKMYAGKPVGTLCQQTGYIRCTIETFRHFAHRIAWKMIYGVDPDQIDHINGDRSDNRIDNLRNVPVEVNAKNRKMYANNTTGVNGVSFHERDKTWGARVGTGRGEEVYLGSFDTKAEAMAARQAANIILEYHENHGIFDRK